ncbi:MAG: porin, partial [Chloroflexota bacterium]
GQATWFGWNNFQDIDAEVNTGTDPDPVVQNYQTVWAFAVGAEYKYSDKLTLRGGMQYDETPTTDQYRTTRTPDGDRTWLSTGATYSLNDKIDLDFAATYIWISEEEISVTRNTPFSGLGGTTQVNADTDGSVGIVAAGFTYKF